MEFSASNIRTQGHDGPWLTVCEFNQQENLRFKLRASAEGEFDET